jgi:hypothetical protein
VAGYWYDVIALRNKDAIELFASGLGGWLTGVVHFLKHAISRDRMLGNQLAASMKMG